MNLEMSMNKMQSKLALRVVAREDASKVLKMMLWDLRLVSVVKKFVILSPMTGQYELTISYKTYTYAFDNSLKSLTVGARWRSATAKNLTIETAVRWVF
jgi:hypothetical protein